jgi:hypothetical protein
VTRRFRLTFDYLCPFARNANEHVLAGLRDGADWDVAFLPFSLAQGHVEEGQPSVWERDEPSRSSGVLALQVGVTVRDVLPARFLDVHEALFAARHDEGTDIKDPAVLRAVLERLDIDPEAIFAQIDDGTALSTLRREHTEAADRHQVWGVPTFITDARAVFVRVMDRPDGDGRLARQRIDHVLDLVDSPLELHEFKQVDLTV